MLSLSAQNEKSGATMKKNTYRILSLGITILAGTFSMIDEAVFRFFLVALIGLIYLEK